MQLVGASWVEAARRSIENFSGDQVGPVLWLQQQQEQQQQQRYGSTSSR